MFSQGLYIAKYICINIYIYILFSKTKTKCVCWFAIHFHIYTVHTCIDEFVHWTQEDGTLTVYPLYLLWSPGINPMVV